MESSPSPSLQCPRPLHSSPVIQMAHGGGGRLMSELLGRLLPLLPGSEKPSLRHDGAVVSVADWERLAFTTDSYVVNPLFFPGGDIGKLAVNGTVNDLAMCGAVPKVLSCALIIEEGFPVASLERVLRSMAAAAELAGIEIITGDTKVVDRGKGDGLYINTAGIGVLPSGILIGPQNIQAGDAIIINGDLGRHAVAVMGARADMVFDPPIESDSIPLHRLVRSLLESGIPVHCLRDATRGGLASTLVELAESAELGMRLFDDKIAVGESVRSACEILGLDPLYLANEGRCVVIVPAQHAEGAVALMRELPEGREAVVIGRTTKEHKGMLVLEGPYGTERCVPMLSGEQLPRIC
ncbi:MAG: hydrogenase expression/formation protein HypE [Proteobacteria bacterium]|nr:hydrogenase expression/formation protein HypE [Pseudomonadota bacterium]